MNKEKLDVYGLNKKERKFAVQIYEKITHKKQIKGEK